ncbi:toxin glutamine deamidase domain-containing protein [Nocardia aurantia]|uniref:RelA/SpoT domain-containing protein n=1 Tax=Nocardia aurantia TaxID=2585199 RepID=A0A7K0DQ63_9NOCA|nr:toxin glutamine deamidase domain-containing protein [Nocardia aurantia]MQY27916.1 hypothetical protein [Nocardia aurantia]
MGWTTAVGDWMPGWLMQGLNFGAVYPKGDQDALFALGDAWKQAAADLDKLQPELRGATAKVPHYYEGDGADAIAAEFAMLFDGGDYSIQRLVDTLDGIGHDTRAAGTEIEYAKIQSEIFAVLTLWQVISLASTLYGTALVPGVLLAARASLRVFAKQVMERLAAIGARAAGREAAEVLSREIALPLAREAMAPLASQAAKVTLKDLAAQGLRSGLHGLALGAGIEAGVQAVQAAEGHLDDGFSLTRIVETGLQWGAGGLIGGPASRKLGAGLRGMGAGPRLGGVLSGLGGGLAGAGGMYLGGLGTQVYDQWRDPSKGIDYSFSPQLLIGGLTMGGLGGARGGWQASAAEAGRAGIPSGSPHTSVPAPTVTDATRAAGRQAYLDLQQQVHPDKTAARDLPDQVKQRGEEISKQAEAIRAEAGRTDFSDRHVEQLQALSGEWQQIAKPGDGSAPPPATAASTAAAEPAAQAGGAPRAAPAEGRSAPVAAARAAEPVTPAAVTPRAGAAMESRPGTGGALPDHRPNITADSGRGPVEPRPGVPVRGPDPAAGVVAVEPITTEPVRHESPGEHKTGPSHDGQPEQTKADQPGTPRQDPALADEQNDHGDRNARRSGEPAEFGTPKDADLGDRTPGSEPAGQNSGPVHAVTPLRSPGIEAPGLRPASGTPSPIQPAAVAGTRPTVTDAPRSVADAGSIPARDVRLGREPAGPGSGPPTAGTTGPHPTVPPRQHGVAGDIESIRPYEGPRNLRRDNPRWQKIMEDNFPKDGSGRPVRYADPRTGWVAHGNDGGRWRPGRSNNCADVTRSFLSSWFGRPTCAQPRAADWGSPMPSWRLPERDAARNIELFTGANFTHEGAGLSGYEQTAAKLRAAGPGSAAAVVVHWPEKIFALGGSTDGGAHAFAAVNVHGEIVWVDMQINRVSETPVHGRATDVFSIVLDRNGNPFTGEHARWSSRDPAARPSPPGTEPQPHQEPTPGADIEPAPVGDPATGQRHAVIDALRDQWPDLDRALEENPKTLRSVLGHAPATDMLHTVMTDIGAGLHASGALDAVRTGQAGPEHPAVARILADYAGAQPNEPLVHATFREISTQVTEQARRNGPSTQPGFDPTRTGDQEYVTAFIDKLRAEAVPTQQALNEITSRIAHDTGGEASWRTEVKQRERCLAKTFEAHGDASKLLDVVGAKIRFTGIEPLYAALDALRADPRLEIVRIKDRIADSTPSGNRSVLLNVRMSNGHIAELKLGLKSFERPASNEHPLYELRRDIDSRALREDRPLTATERLVQAGLEAAARADYGTVWHDEVRAMRGRAEAVDAVRVALPDHPALADAIAGFVLDSATHSTNAAAALVHPQTRAATVQTLAELARSSLLGNDRNADEALNRWRDTHPGAGPLFEPIDHTANVGSDGTKRLNAWVENAKNIDPARLSGHPPDGPARGALDDYARRLAADVHPAVEAEVRELAMRLGGDTTVSSRTKSAEGILDKVGRMVAGSRVRAPRPDYRAGDVIDAVGARITVADTDALARLLDVVENHYGTGDHGRILEIDNMYATPKGNPRYRVVPLVIGIHVDGVPYTYELQLTTRRASIAADLEHNTLFKPYVPTDEEQRQAIRRMQAEAAALDQQETRSHQARRQP